MNWCEQQKIKYSDRVAKKKHHTESYMPAPKTSHSFPFVYLWILLFLLRSINSPIDDDLNGPEKFSETVVWGSPLLIRFLRFPPFRTKLKNARLLSTLDSKMDDAKDASEAAKEDNVTPSAPSWCGGGNFSRLLVIFTLTAIIFLRCMTEPHSISTIGT